ncbi:MAG: methionyl-tRNA formyltransferase [Lachnospiraceae bacterium]|nr:methionyl-tRNA formyltransferase [Lachnospiraceae bacterium]
MRVIFMGTPDFSVPTLRTLAESDNEVIAVYTQPDKPKGRGHAMQFTPVKECALEYNIPVYQPNRVRDVMCIEEIREMAPDVIIVVAYGQILPKELLEIPTYGCINVHASLLPKYRGAAPIQWTVIDGEEFTGVTAMQMDVGLDTGDMLEKIIVPIEKDETGGSLHDKLSVLGGDIILNVFEKIKNGTLTREKQDDEVATYCGKLDKTMGLLDFSKPALQLERLIRGLNPWPCAYTSLDGKNLKLWKAYVVGFDELQDVEHIDDSEYGTILKVTKNAIMVKAMDGMLSITELQLEGKKRMDAADFIRGYQALEGKVLG